ncbi:DUF4224 domain-containing protein [Paraperlucidibaca sp.]|uniref:DUF4224 domain-containing protein n=1 Tax=Paraperlucidibaca sp. TaxID=2708021 RepID=UPI0030F42474
MVLSKQELRELTGRARHGDQQDWLIKQRIPFLVGADGIPKVLRTTLSSILGAPPMTEAIRSPKLRLGA